MRTLKDVSRPFVDLTNSHEYLVTEGFPLYVIIGDPIMENLPAVMELGRKQVRLTKDDHEVELSLIEDCVGETPARKDQMAKNSHPIHRLDLHRRRVQTMKKNIWRKNFLN